MKINFLYWVCVGLQGFQLAGFLTQINQKLIETTLPITLITLGLIGISGYVDYSSKINNCEKVKLFNILAMHISLMIGVLISISLGGYLGK